MSKVNYNSTIFEVCQIINKQIETDFGGGADLVKTFITAYLVQNQDLKNFAEIGVYKGKSFFPVAYSIHKNNGKSYGIDPYNLNAAREVDVEENLRKKIDSFLENLDFEKLYKSVVSYKEECGFGKNIKLIREPSEKAIDFFKQNNIELDIVHIDGNHDTKYVKQDYENYYEVLKKGGFLIFDDIDWDSIKIVYEQAKNQCIEIFNCDTFGILLKQPRSTLTLIQAEILAKKIKEIYNKILQIPAKFAEKPTVSVGILTYNHVDYIEECINSVVTQTGDFILNIFICDDCSNDGTSEKINNIVSNISQNQRSKFNYIRNEKNLGIITNLKKLVNLLKNSDYFTFCEGDDYYLSTTRIAEHLKYHKTNPQTVLSFNKILFYFQNEDSYEIFEPDLKYGNLTTEGLIGENFIDNFSSCFYNSRMLDYIKDDLFDMYTTDWMFNIFCSQYGDIGILNKPLTVYRKYDKSILTEMEQGKKIKLLIESLDQYNKYLHFAYDKYFTNFRNKCITKINNQFVEQLNLAVIDDVFPQPLSGFRYQEFSSILESIKDSKVFTTGESLSFLGDKNIEEILIEFKRKRPELSNKVQEIYDIGNFNCKLLYCTFLYNAYHNIISRAEQYKIPFIFTLYPGGAFGLNNPDSDAKLKRVLISPFFKKVIVTQSITYDYLINKKLCPKEKIEFIFGAVKPLVKSQLDISNKKYYKYGKDSLDVCFVAQKYTKYGEDKGYDVFIAVARQLSKRHNNINFHVVGPFNEGILDTREIKNIKFYGTREQNWFDDFYKDKEIILSPNINGKIHKGSFDGFPLGCLTDAATRKVAMFCTDPLDLNNNRFTEGEEIVIVEHDAEKIVEKIEYYINNPEKLKDICEKGCEKVETIYSYENQIKPRLEILKQAIEEQFIYNKNDFGNIEVKLNWQKIINFFKIIINKIMWKLKNFFCEIV